MGKTFVKWLIGDITLKTCGEKIGYLFNNKLLNVSTSGAGVGLTAMKCAHSAVKAVASPLPWCKCLYITASILNGVSCTSSSLCLLSGYSCIAPIPMFTGALALATSVGGQGCNALADCMDPANSATARAVDVCIDVATKPRWWG